MKCATGNVVSRSWRKEWAIGLLTALWLACGPAAAHTAGTTGYAKVTVAGQTVRYAITLPLDGLPLGGTAQDSRDLAAVVARHVAITADGTPCAGVPSEVRLPSPGSASVEVVVLYACAAPVRNFSIRDGLDAVLGADHHTIADIQWPGGAVGLVLLTERALVGSM